MISNFKTGPNVPFPPFVHSNEENKMDFGDLRDYMDQDIPARQYPTANLEFGPIAQFLTDMPYWMNLTPEVLNVAMESLPIPIEGPVSPGILVKRPYR
jgi:hypothetical protein